MALSLDNGALAMACDLARPDRDDDAGPANGGRIVALSPLAGKPAPKSLLTDPARLVREFYSRRPDPANLQETVSFGTSGHRGSPLKGSFNEAHILAIT